MRDRMRYMVSLALRLVALHPVLCTNQADSFIAIFHPAPGTCFPNNSAVSASISVSTHLFRTLRVHTEDLEYDLALNDRLVAAIAFESRDFSEGYSQIVAIPGLADGEYLLSFRLFRSGSAAGSSGDRHPVGAAESRFVVDNRWGCSRSDLLKSSDFTEPQLAAELRRPIPAKRLSERHAIHEDGIWGRRLEDGEESVLNLALNSQIEASSESASGRSPDVAADGTVISPPGEEAAVPAVTGKETFAECAQALQEALAAASTDRWHCGAWISVDLGGPHQIEAVDVVGALTVQSVGSYPEVKGGEMLAPFGVVLLEHAGGPDTAGEGVGGEDGGWARWQPVAGTVYTAADGEVSDNMYSWTVADDGRAGRVPFASKVVIVLLHNATDSARAAGSSTDAFEPPPSRAMTVTEVEIWGRGRWECAAHCVHGDCDGRGRCSCWSGDSMGQHCSGNVLHALAFLPPRHPLQLQHAEESLQRCRREDGGACAAAGDGGRAREAAGARGGEALPAGEGAHVLRLAPRARGEGWYEPAAVAELLSAIERRQHPPTCAPELAMEVNWDNSGLSAMLFFISGLVSLGLSLGRAAVLTDAQALVFATCPSRDFACLFLPFSNCTPAAIAASTYRADPRSGAGQGGASAWDARGGFPVAAQEAEAIGGASEAVENRYWVKGRFWYRAVLMQFVFRPQPSLLEALRVEEAMAAMGFDDRREGVLGWHVRLNVQDVLRIGHGPTLGRHLQALRTVARRYGIAKVFVATDDPSVVDRAAALAPELSFMHYQFNRSMLSECGGKTNDCWLEGRLGRGELDADEVTRSWLMDVLLLSHAHAFVGQWGSNLSRLAYLLAVNRRRSLLPFISVDGPWRYSHLPMGSFA